MVKTKYLPIGVKLSEDKENKLKQAAEENCGVCLVFNYEDLDETSEKKIFFTRRQVKKMDKAFNNNKGVNLSFSSAQVKYNVKHGGFLGALLTAARTALPLIGRLGVPLVKKVLPQLGISALGGLTEGLTKKLLGNGLYLSKNGQVAQVETDGKGLFLNSVNGKGLELYGNGMFIVQDGNVQRGEGLLSSIPLIGPLLKMIL